MAYDASKLKLITPGMGSGPAVWNYTSADARATVEGAGYFTETNKSGLKLGDTVFVVYTTGYVTTIHSVSAVSSNAATINAAVLS